MHNRPSSIYRTPAQRGGRPTFAATGRTREGNDQETLLDGGAPIWHDKELGLRKFLCDDLGESPGRVQPDVPLLQSASSDQSARSATIAGDPQEPSNFDLEGETSRSTGGEQGHLSVVLALQMDEKGESGRFLQSDKNINLILHSLRRRQPPPSRNRTRRKDRLGAAGPSDTG